MAEANAEQRARWNDVIGPRWVAVTSEIDAELTEVTDLALAHAAPRPGEVVLELGSGAGEMAVRLARAVLPLGWVMGVDFSRPMLWQATKTFRHSSMSNARFRLADVQTEPLKRAMFDLAFSRFGVMFYDNPIAAFTNVHGAMKPSGRLSFVCWGPLERNPHWSIPRKIAVKHLGAAEPSKPRTPGPMALADPDYIEEVLTGAGWRAITIEEKTPALVRAPMERAVRFATTMGPAGGLIRERQASEEVVAAIQAEVAEGFRPYEHDGIVRVPGSIYLVGARV